MASGAGNGKQKNITSSKAQRDRGAGILPDAKLTKGVGRDARAPVAV